MSPLPFTSGCSRGGIALRLLALAAFLGALVVVLWMLLLKPITASWVRARTGFPTEIGLVTSNPFTGTVRLEGARVSNPDSFGEPDFIILDQARIKYAPFSLTQKQRVVEQAEVDIELIVLVKDKQGRLNYEIFGDGFKDQPIQAAGFFGAGKVEDKTFLIKDLRVKWHRLRVANYATPEPVVREIVLDYNYTYRDVTDWSELLVPFAVSEFPAIQLGTQVLNADESGRTDFPFAPPSALEQILQTGRDAAGGLFRLFEKLEKSPDS